MSPTPDHPRGRGNRKPGEQQLIDPRGPRFGAAITSALLLVDVFLGIAAPHPAALALLSVIVVLFAWGAVAGVQRHPYALLYARVVRPRLSPPAELEPAAPPTFAQAVGLLVTLVGLLLGLAGIAAAVPVAAAVAFVAAFLNAAFGVCLGCSLYVVLVRARILRPTRPV